MPADFDGDVNEEMAPRSVPGERIVWARLMDDHDRIAGWCADIVAVTQRPGLHCATASRKLFELAVLVADHLGAEDEVVDLTAVALRAEYPPETIAAMVADLDRLKADWKTFIGHWLPGIERIEWPLFRRDAKTMMARLSRQVARESALLYDDALRHGVIGLGPAVVH